MCSPEISHSNLCESIGPDIIIHNKPTWIVANGELAVPLPPTGALDDTKQHSLDSVDALKSDGNANAPTAYHRMCLHSLVSATGRTHNKL